MPVTAGQPVQPCNWRAVLAPRQLLDACRIHPLERVADPDAGDDAVGCDLGERHENESALEQMWVGQLQGRVVEDNVVISQDVEIDGPRPPVLFVIAVAAERVFAGLGAGQQRLRGASVVETAMTALVKGGWSVTPQGGVR